MIRYTDYTDASRTEKNGFFYKKSVYLSARSVRQIRALREKILITAIPRDLQVVYQQNCNCRVFANLTQHTIIQRIRIIE